MFVECRCGKLCVDHAPVSWLRVHQLSALCVPVCSQVLGHSGHLPSVYIRITVKYHLLRRLLGSKAQEGDKSAKVGDVIRSL